MTERNVYFIRRHDALLDGGVGWDETASAVIVAEGKDEVRQFMARKGFTDFDYAGEEGPEPWLTGEGSSVILLGPYTGHRDETHLVCRDFKRG